MIYSLFSTNGTLTPCTKEALEIGDQVRYEHDGMIYTITGFDSIGATIINAQGKQHTGQRLDSISPFTRITHLPTLPQATEEEIDRLQVRAMQYQNAAHEAQEREAEQHKIEFDEQIRKLRQRFPGAQPDQPGKNCKKLLQDAFPHVKFSVRYSSYSGGNSLDVSWEFGPSRKEVERIADQFQSGSFDGMTDCYEYDHSAASRAWSAVMGSVKYVSCQRETGNLWQSVQDALKSKYTANTDRNTIEREASSALHNATFPQGFKEGDAFDVVWDEDDDHPSRWTLTFPEPEKPTTPEPTKPEPAHMPTNGVTVTENADKDGVEVRFSSKPAATILARLKDAGFRWSKFQGLWYAKRNTRTLAIAYELAGRERDAADPAGAMVQAMEDYAADSWYQANYGMERY